MTKAEELDLFLERADELIESKYIIAEIKIVNLLKVIATSETLIAIFKNCLDNFDYAEAKKKYLVKSKYFSGDKGEFILPPSSRELLAFIINILVDIDAKRINFSDFLCKFFYEDGSFSASYSSFINSMIKPFRNSVKMLMESVIIGKLQDPIEAFTEEEERKLREKEQAEREKQKEKELLKKVYGESLKAIREILLNDKTKLKYSKIKEEEKKNIELILNTLANVIETDDKDAINYAFTAYKYMTRTHEMLFWGERKKVIKYMKDVLNEI